MILTIANSLKLQGDRPFHPWIGRSHLVEKCDRFWLRSEIRFGGRSSFLWERTITTIKLVDFEMGLTEEITIFRLKHKYSNALPFAAG